MEKEQTQNLPSELKAMIAIHDALEGLQEEERVRVLKWSLEKFASSGIEFKNFGKGLPKDTSNRPGINDGFVNGNGNSKIEDFEEVGEFFGRVHPKTDADKVLAVACFFHKKKGLGELTSQELNGELKNLGYGVSNVTRSIELLMERRPSLMIQTRKDGTSRQARKKYKVTQAGFDYINSSLNTPPAEP